MKKLKCKCGAEFAATPEKLSELAGKKLKCNVCGRVAMVPAKEEPAALPAHNTEYRRAEKNRVNAIVVCAVEVVIFALIGVLLGWKHVGGFLPIVVLLTLMGITWSTIIKY